MLSGDNGLIYENGRKWPDLSQVDAELGRIRLAENLIAFWKRFMSLERRRRRRLVVYDLTL